MASHGAVRRRGERHFAGDDGLMPRWFYGWHRDCVETTAGHIARGHFIQHKGVTQCTST